MFGDEMMEVPVLRREVGLLIVSGICGAVLARYVFLCLDRVERQ